MENHSKMKMQQYASTEFEVVPYKYNHEYIESEQDMLDVGYVNAITIGAG